MTVLMALLYASMTDQRKTDTLQSVSLGDSDNTIEGDRVLWDCDTEPTAARTLTVRPFDSSRHGEYQDTKKPCVKIKCHADCSSYEITVKDADANTLYTFTENRSVTPIYICLHLTATGGWELV